MVINTLRSSRLNFLMLYYCTCMCKFLYLAFINQIFSLMKITKNRTAKILTLCILFTHSTV